MKNYKTIFRAKIAIIILCLATLIIFVVRLSVIGQLAPRGEELYNIQMEAKRMKEENSLLKEKILQAESLNTINELARTRGFIDASSKDYLLLQ